MSFSRADFYGKDFDWYASDSDGYVARFVTGFGPMPRDLFTDEEAYFAVSGFFRTASSISLSSLSTWAQSQRSKGIGDYSLLLAEARRGVFIFGEQEYGPTHRLYALPATPLNLTSMPDFAREFVSRFNLPAFRFSVADTLNVLEHFACVP